MDMKNILKKHPLIEDIAECREVFWVNPCAASPEHAKPGAVPDIDIDSADARLLRFAPFIEKMFPDAKGGIIESRLKEIDGMRDFMAKGGVSPVDIKGRLFLKCDSHLPVSGSIKARGGIYEVLKLAEKIAMEEGDLTYDDDYSVLAGEKYRSIFGKYKVAVGSTGNLGLSIGIISAAIGFEVTVHMSADARRWKKDMLRARGAKVVEYPDDYEAAVAQGRREAAADPSCHFVDDENSQDLFEGYAVAGKRLKKQLEAQNITIDENRRLYVYLPCGVGGAPGGVAWGIKQYFGDNAYCFFAEPTHAPCMVLGLVSGLKNGIAVGDIGIDGKTEADGLAVGRPSALVSDVMETELTGCFTVNDEKLYRYLAMLWDSEDIFIEPSACAAFDGLKYVCGAAGSDTLPDGMAAYFPMPDENSVHIVWATGGNMVPEGEKELYYRNGCGEK